VAHNCYIHNFLFINEHERSPSHLAHQFRAHLR